MNTQNSYCKNNRIRTKLLLFIDNEIQNKIKQNNKKLKINCEEVFQVQITFEEIFTQKEIEKYGFSSSNITNLKKNDNSDKTISTFDNSSNKIKKKSTQKERDIYHPKTFAKEDNLQNKLLNVSFHKKISSIKKQSSHSSSFLILVKQKIGAEYLKHLCNNLKMCKNYKKPVKRIKSIIVNKTKLFNLSKDKKPSKKSNEIKLKKAKNDNQHKSSLFRKTQKGNFIINSKNKIFINSTLIKNKQKE